MTPSRLALIAVSELHRAGFLTTNIVNGPSSVVEKAILRRIALGDVVCIPDEQEKTTKNDHDCHFEDEGC